MELSQEAKIALEQRQLMFVVERYIEKHPESNGWTFYTSNPTPDRSFIDEWTGETKYRTDLIVWGFRVTVVKGKNKPSRTIWSEKHNFFSKQVSSKSVKDLYLVVLDSGLIIRDEEVDNFNNIMVHGMGEQELHKIAI